MLKDFLSLIYPDVCLSCGTSLMKFEEVVCTHCQYLLPKTNFHNNADNPLARVFWGRLNLVTATAYLYFTKGEKVQHLLHQLKYNGQKQIGIYFGKLFGEELCSTEKFKEIDVIIPVPLHPSRLRKRGYNQSEMIGIGMAESMSAKLDTESLYRRVATQTQTKKSRFNRWENVKSIFALKNEDLLSGKHLLLIDDVITTGSTIEACVQTLQQIPSVKISVASLAVPVL